MFGIEVNASNTVEDAPINLRGLSSARRGKNCCSYPGCSRWVLSKALCRTHGGGTIRLLYILQMKSLCGVHDATSAPRCSYSGWFKWVISKGLCFENGGGSRWSYLVCLNPPHSRVFLPCP
ncbi:hypothetical protein PHMEG_00029025 [Phytophthora megakarya]|uniref:Uncharacterized protein n=1 Tax=Phytophthora megakarya TaxID=4795 RepID=A0A225V4J3_9STRA|nr:hypothetical protein PHMEG_00029025 [Phytophthora megakarya]